MVQEPLSLAPSSAVEFRGSLKISANLQLHFIIKLRLVILDLLVMQKSQMTPDGNIGHGIKMVTQRSHLLLKVAQREDQGENHTYGLQNHSLLHILCIILYYNKRIKCITLPHYTPSHYLSLFSNGKHLNLDQFHPN